MAKLFLGNGMRVDSLNDLRPFVKDGKAYVSRTTERVKREEVPLPESEKGRAFLTKDDWREYDTAIFTTIHPTWKLLRSCLDRGLFVEFEMPEDCVYHDGDDTYPLPIVSKSFIVCTRQVEQSHKAIQPINVDVASLAAQEVAQKIDQMVFGTCEAPVYNDVPLYGMCNHPNRITQTLTDPYLKDGKRNPDWSPAVFYAEVAKAEATLRNRGFEGQIGVFIAEDWDSILPSSVLKSAFVTPHALPSGTVVLCEMSPETLQIYFGIDVNLVQWNSDNPNEVEMRVLCCIVPLIHKNHCGIVHLSAR